MPRPCPRCGFLVPDPAAACPQCGAEAEASAAAVMARAAALQEAGHFAEALEAWDEALALQPGAPEAVEQSAFCFRAAELERQGADWGDQAWGQQGITFFEAGEWALADLAYGRVLEQQPLHLSALCGKGLANFKWAAALQARGGEGAPRRFRAAALAIREALRLHPGNAALHRVLALCEREMGPE